MHFSRITLTVIVVDLTIYVSFRGRIIATYVNTKLYGCYIILIFITHTHSPWSNQRSTPPVRIIEQNGKPMYILLNYVRRQ